MEEIILTTKIEVYQQDELTETINFLIEAAKNAAAKAYSPYSNYHVGCAIRLENGEILEGSNQENAAYGATICAERTVLSYALAHYPETAVTDLVVVAMKSGSVTPEVCTPCGECRQVMKEVEWRSNHPITLWMVGAEKVYKAENISAVLPLGFPL